MKSLLFVIDSMNGGGAERALLTLLSSLDKKRYNIELLLLYNEGQLLSEARTLANCITILPPKMKFYQAHKFSFFKIYYRVFYQLIFRFPTFIKFTYLRGKSYDTEIAFLDGLPLQIVGSWFTKAATVGWIHSDMRHFYELKGTKRALQNLNAVVCVSKDSQSTLCDRFPHLNKSKIWIINNPIDINKIRQNSVEQLEFTKLTNEIIITGIGRLTPQKRFDRLLYAVDHISKELKVTLWLVGDGSELEMLKSISSSISSPNLRVVFWGFQDNPHKFMQNADIVALSSDFEAFPVVIEEALALCKPVIATNCCGISELIENGKTGVITDINDKSFSMELLKLCSNHDFRESLSSNLKALQSPYDSSIISDKFEELLDSL